MYGTDYFQILHGEAIMIGELAPSGSGTFEQGTAVDQCDPEACIRANGVVTGFLSKKITDAGPSFEDLNFGGNLPALKGQKVTLLNFPHGSQIVVEGEPSIAYNTTTVGLLITGTTTGFLVGTEALNTKLSVKNGLWYKAQTGDRVQGLLKGWRTPVVSASNLRCLIEIVQNGEIV